MSVKEKCIMVGPCTVIGVFVSYNGLRARESRFTKLIVVILERLVGTKRFTRAGSQEATL